MIYFIQLFTLILKLLINFIIFKCNLLFSLHVLFFTYIFLLSYSTKISSYAILCEYYQPSLKRDPSYKDYLDRIGQVFNLVKMFSMLFRFIFGFNVANQSHCRFILGCLPPEECLTKECLVMNNASSLQTFSFSHLANIFFRNSYSVADWKFGWVWFWR